MRSDREPDVCSETLLQVVYSSNTSTSSIVLPGGAYLFPGSLPMLPGARAEGPTFILSALIFKARALCALSRWAATPLATTTQQQVVVAASQADPRGFRGFRHCRGVGL